MADIFVQHSLQTKNCRYIHEFVSILYAIKIVNLSGARNTREFIENRYYEFKTILDLPQQLRIHFLYKYVI